MERLLIEKRAKSAGKTLSRYMVDCAMGKEMRFLTEEEKTAYVTLSDYANNFARISNLIKARKDIYREVIDLVVKIREHLKRLKND